LVFVFPKQAPFASQQAIVSFHQAFISLDWRPFVFLISLHHGFQPSYGGYQMFEIGQNYPPPRFESDLHSSLCSTVQSINHTDPTSDTIVT
jgi:hypothetical protein